MVYCTKCGLKNEDDAATCVKCGAPLRPSLSRPTYRTDGCFGSRRERREDECFGLPYGGAIVGIIFGLVIIIIGIAIYFRESVWDYLWPFIIITFGSLIVIGTLYRLLRR